MRIATGIIALFLSLVIGLQSCAVSFGGALSHNQNLTGGGSLGVLVAFTFLLGGAFSFKLPKVSMMIFIISCLLGFISASSGFKDMNVWAFVAIILAIMSYFGGKPKNRNVKSNQEPIDKAE